MPCLAAAHGAVRIWYAADEFALLAGAGDCANRARSNAVLTSSVERGLAQLGMSGQTEIIVRGQIDYTLAIEGADRRLLVIEHAQLEMGTLGLKFVELIG